MGSKLYFFIAFLGALLLFDVTDARAQGCADNLSPVTNSNSRTTNEDVSITVTSSSVSSANNLLTNDTDPDSDPLSVTGFMVNGESGTPVHSAGTAYVITGIGTITINTNGSYAFSPVVDYNDSVPLLNYIVTDTCGATDTGTLTIMINPVEDCASLSFPSYNIVEDGQLPIRGSFNDPDSATGATYTITVKLSNPNSLADNGSFSGASSGGVTITIIEPDSLIMVGSFADLKAFISPSNTSPVLYIPPVDYNTSSCLSIGQLTIWIFKSGFSTFCDREARNINISASTDALAYSVSACQDATKIFNVLNGTGTNSGLPNNFEVNTASPPQTVTVTAINSAVVVNPITTTHGQITVDTSGDVIYTPADGYTGVDSFTYTTQPGTTGCAETRKVTITVQVSPVAPTVTVVQPTCADPDGSINVTAPTGSGLTYSIDSITYQTSTAFTAVPPGTYLVTVKNSNGCVSAETSTTITPVDCAPVAVDDADSTNINTPSSGTFASNDTCSSTPCSYNTTPVTDPTNGTVTINADGTYTYTPNTDFVGTDTFRYAVCDADGQCDTAIVMVTVDGPPVAMDDSNTTPINTMTNGDLASNDQCGNAPCTYNTTPVTDPTNGTVTINADGTYTYTPNTDFVGTDTFRYVLCDVDGQCDTAMVMITVDDPLPVVLRDITISLEDGCNIVLDWMTGTESGFDYFEVESGKDGRKFETMGRVPATGSNSTYHYLVPEYFDATSYHRLKMVDLDNSYKYSKVLSINSDCQQKTINVYPSPTYGKVTVEGTDKGDRIQVYDVVGKLLIEKTAKGATETFDIGQYSSGIYTMMIIDAYNRKSFVSKITRF